MFGNHGLDANESKNHSVHYAVTSESTRKVPIEIVFSLRGAAVNEGIQIYDQQTTITDTYTKVHTKRL